MNVELGAGAAAREGWLAVDLNPLHADVLADALRLPFADASIDSLRAVDVLEHISYRWTDAALHEWARVLRPGGMIYVQVPSAGTIMRWFANGDPRLCVAEQKPCSPLYGATWRLLGGHGDGVYVDDAGDWRWNAHYAFFDEKSLPIVLARHGLMVTTFQENPHPNLLVNAMRRA